jgi:hypothetical protein
MKTDLDDLEKMSQDIEQAIQAHTSGKGARETKFAECTAFVECKKEIVDGTVAGAVKDEVDEIIEAYDKEVSDKRAQCQAKNDSLLQAEGQRQEAEADEREKQESHDGNKELVDTCLVKCEDLKALFENAEEKCDHKLMYFFLQQLEGVVEQARATCVYSDVYEKLLCDSWDALREAKDETREAREVEDLTRRQAEKCEAEFTELAEDRRGELIERLSTTESVASAV